MGMDDVVACGIDLGPFLSWLNCVPASAAAAPRVPAARAEYDPLDDSWKERT